MSETMILAEIRSETGKGYARKARRRGVVPGIVYGEGTANRSVEIEAAVLERFLATAGAGRPVGLKIGDGQHTVLVKAVQKDPARGTLLHVDLHEVRLDREVNTSVPLSLVGQDARPSDGGVVTLSVHELQVACLPMSIPESIPVDVSQIALGQGLTVGELNLPAGVRAIDDPETVVATVVAPRLAAETDEAAEEAEEATEAAEGTDEPAAEAEA